MGRANLQKYYQERKKLYLQLESFKAGESKTKKFNKIPADIVVGSETEKKKDKLKMWMEFYIVDAE